MKTVYKCDFCGNEYSSVAECLNCEEGHFEGAEKIKYLLTRNPRTCICDYCAHSYYVYGCERDCEYAKCGSSNNYIDFKQVEPLHDKRANGGI